jgi:hypothetical protein
VKQIERRVGSLEFKAGLASGWDVFKTTHLIGIHEGEDELSALRRYIDSNPKEPVGPDDNVIWLTFVKPKFDADGKHVRRTATDDKQAAAHGDRSLAELLAELGNCNEPKS